VTQCRSAGQSIGWYSARSNLFLHCTFDSHQIGGCPQCGSLSATESDEVTL
jgi:hypothetical protein